MAEKLTITLDWFERDLILRYGYPFDEIAAPLKAKRERRGNVRVTATLFDWEQVLGDLSRSLNHDQVPDELFDEVNAVADMIEFEVAHHGRRDVLRL